MNKMNITYALIAIAITLIIAGTAHAERPLLDKDKESHVIYSAVGFTGFDVVMTNMDVTYPDEKAFVAMMIAGYWKEQYYANKDKHNYVSKNDMKANAIGAVIQYAGVKCAKTFGFNPLKVEW